ncbi:L-rhamnose-proton symport family protein [Blastomonas sp. RAC04]|uniref:L-rhamnose/proton symporter RhaT n=1 Tax=Blastomonas sp. RAC04 TaxID=1842535 RepID=UPI00083E3096|nr:L-rhamnose/proton symporter RhaT [Blastomonas sp. RAC04]AOF99617.1 L-rhamnose-proton symport family protein [Blastomonas sp. RAC04]
MTPNPLIGVLYHWLGGFASASFYVPYRAVRGWSWEIYWLTGGLFSWAIAPWLFASLQTNDLLMVFREAPDAAIIWPVVFGMLWGFGGLTYGLTMRYLGLSLGMAVVLGLCTVFGTLIPPLFQGDFQSKLLDSLSGNIILAGLAITLAGIIVVAIAGARKDASLTDAQKADAVAEFNFRKGIGVAIFSGVMSSCFAFGLAAGEPVKAVSAAHGTGPLWTGLPVLCLIMAGGLVTNGLWCAFLILRNRSAGQWVGRSADVATEVPAPAAANPSAALQPAIPLLANFGLCALAGTTWYFQFFFYTMGESQMGRLGFSSWTLHMASIIIFGTVWGFALREWRDAPGRIKAMVWSGVALLVMATIVIGYGNMLGA